MSTERNQWGSRIGFVLAASGSAVGLGNIWKFPYIAGENGGGFFVLFYLILILLIGIPLMYSEILVGKLSQANVVSSFRKLKAGPFTVTGWLGLITGFLILSFYSVVAGWTLYYLLNVGIFDSFPTTTAAASELFAGDKTGLLHDATWQTLYHSIFMAVTVGIVAAGVNKGIERVVKVLMPTLCLLILVLMVMSLIGPGGGEALNFMFSFKMDKFTAEGALLALGHVFFSLSLGMGAMITYGSYMNRKESLSRPTLTICAIDTLVALAAGLVLFPIVFGHPADATVNATFEVERGAITSHREDVGGGKIDIFAAREAFVEGTPAASEACRAKGPDAKGTIKTAITVGRDGEASVVRQVRVTESAVAGSPYEACLVEQIQAFAMPLPQGEPGAGPGLVFVTLPARFAQMPGGTFFGMAFFALLFMAALSSAISILEVVVAYAHEKTGAPRTFISGGVGGAIWTVGLLISLDITSPETPLGDTWLDILDNLTSVFLLPIGGLLVALFVAFKLAPKVVERGFGDEAGTRLFKVWKVLVRTVAPIGLALTLFIGIKALIDTHAEAQGGVAGHGGTVASLAVLLVVGLIVITGAVHNDVLRRKGELVDDDHPDDPEHS